MQILQMVDTNSRKYDRRGLETGGSVSTVRDHDLAGLQQPDMTDTSLSLPSNGTNLRYLEVQEYGGSRALPQLQYTHFHNQESTAQAIILNNREDLEPRIVAGPSETCGNQPDQASIISAATYHRPFVEGAAHVEDEKETYANTCQEWAVWILGPKRWIDPEPSDSRTISICTKLWYLQNIFKNRMLVATQEKLQLTACIAPSVSEWLAESLKGTTLVVASYMSEDVTKGFAVALIDGAINRMSEEYAKGLAKIYLEALQISIDCEEVDVKKPFSPPGGSLLPVRHPLGITEDELEAELERWDFDGARAPLKDFIMQDNRFAPGILQRTQDIEEIESTPAAKRQKLDHQERQNTQSIKPETVTVMKAVSKIYDEEASSSTLNTQIEYDKVTSNERTKKVNDDQDSRLRPQKETNVWINKTMETRTRIPMISEQTEAIPMVLHFDENIPTGSDSTSESRLVTSQSKQLCAERDLSAHIRTHSTPVKARKGTNRSAPHTSGGHEDVDSFIPTSPDILRQGTGPDSTARLNIKTSNDTKGSKIKIGFQSIPITPRTPKKRSTKDIFARVTERKLANGLESVARYGSPTPGSEWSFGEMELPGGLQPLLAEKSVKKAVEILATHSKQHIFEKAATKSRKSRPLKSTFDPNHKAPEPKVPEAMAYRKEIPATVHRYQVSSVNLTSQPNPHNSFLHSSAISLAFKNPYLHPVEGTSQVFGSPPLYYGPVITGGGLKGPTANFQMADQSRNRPKNPAHRLQGRPGSTVIGPRGIARSPSKVPQMTANLPVDNTNTTFRPLLNPYIREPFFHYNETAQSPSPIPGYNPTHSRRPSYSHCSPTKSPEGVAAVPFYAAHSIPKRANRELVTMTFQSVSLRQEGQALLQEVVKTNPACRGLASEADWDNNTSELRITAPAGSNLRGLLMDLFPHVRLKASMS